MTYWADPAYFSATQLQKLTESVGNWRNAINGAAGANIARIFSTGVQSGATWKIRGAENWRGTNAVAETEHSTKTIWVNPDRLEAGNSRSFSDNQIKNMLLHEVGHTLGWGQITTCTQSVMYEFNQASVTSLTCGDHTAVQTHYYCPGCYSPIIIDVDCRNTRLSGPEVPFDMDGDGENELMAWTLPEENDAFLVFERDGTSGVESGRELFGNFTPLSWDMSGPVAQHGFEVLSWFDRLENHGNGDGWIDQADYIYSQLQVWLDDNHNGISEPAELRYLEQWGIKRISTTAELHDRRDRWGNRFAYRGTVEVEHNGEVKACSTFDVFLVTKDGE